MKKSMLLTATAVVLIGVIFCGCGDYNLETVRLETFVSSQATETLSIAETVCVTQVPTTRQKATEATEFSEAEDNIENDSVECVYVQEETMVPTEILYTSTEPPYVSSYVYSDIELEVFELINQEREKASVHPLELSYTYADCAYVRALEADTYWSHTRPDGREYHTVLSDFSFDYSRLYVGENLASGVNSAEDAMEGLMNSPGHRQNILREEYTGVCVAAVPMSGYPGYYVISQLFVGEP